MKPSEAILALAEVTHVLRVAMHLKEHVKGYVAGLRKLTAGLERGMRMNLPRHDCPFILQTLTVF